MGVTLKGLVDTKQNILTAGDKISITSGSLATDPHTIANVARDWLNITPTTTVVISGGTETYVVGLVTGTSIEYRYVDLRSFGSNTNRGLWMLPPAKDPAVIGNWIKLSDEVTAVGTTSFKFKAIPFVSGVAAYNLEVDTATATGAALGFTYDGFSILTPTVMNKIFLNNPGTYVVTAHIKIWAEMTNAGMLGRFKATMSKYMNTTAGPDAGTSDHVLQNFPVHQEIGTTAPTATQNRVHSAIEVKSLFVTDGLTAGSTTVPSGFLFKLSNNFPQTAAGIGADGDFGLITFNEAESFITINKIA